MSNELRQAAEAALRHLDFRFPADDGWNESSQYYGVLDTVRIREQLRTALAAPDTRADGTLLREMLAEYAHEAWSGWMKYLFSKTLVEKLYNGAVIPKNLVERWQRQMNTAYADLPPDEQESDRLEADRMIEIFDRCPRVTAPAQPPFPPAIGFIVSDTMTGEEWADIWKKFGHIDCRWRIHLERRPAPVSVPEK